MCEPVELVASSRGLAADVSIEAMRVVGERDVALASPLAALLAGSSPRARIRHDLAVQGLRACVHLPTWSQACEEENPPLRPPIYSYAWASAWETATPAPAPAPAPPSPPGASRIPALMCAMERQVINVLERACDVVRHTFLLTAAATTAAAAAAAAAITQSRHSQWGREIEHERCSTCNAARPHIIKVYDLPFETSLLALDAALEILELIEDSTDDWREAIEDDREAMAEEAEAPVLVMDAVREESSEEREEPTEDWADESEDASDEPSEESEEPREEAAEAGAPVAVEMAPLAAEAADDRAPLIPEGTTGVDKVSTYADGADEGHNHEVLELHVDGSTGRSDQEGPGTRDQGPWTMDQEPVDRSRPCHLHVLAALRHRVANWGGGRSGCMGSDVPEKIQVWPAPKEKALGRPEGEEQRPNDRATPPPPPRPGGWATGSGARRSGKMPGRPPASPLVPTRSDLRSPIASAPCQRVHARPNAAWEGARVGPFPQPVPVERLRTADLVFDFVRGEGEIFRGFPVPRHGAMRRFFLYTGICDPPPSRTRPAAGKGITAGRGITRPRGAHDDRACRPVRRFGARQAQIRARESVDPSPAVSLGPLVVAGPSQGPEARELELELERDETGLCTTRVGRGAGREGRRQGTVGYETRWESADPRMFGALSCRYRCLSRWSGLVTAQGRLGVGVESESASESESEPGSESESASASEPGFRETTPGGARPY
ncbi:hypothetical protein JHW43_001541 [Diplocarpon mali]|nr:hypothetical protein JHW43_001541 [Diplocarpon mali]